MKYFFLSRCDTKSDQLIFNFVAFAAKKHAKFSSIFIWIIFIYFTQMWNKIWSIDLSWLIRSLYLSLNLSYEGSQSIHFTKYVSNPDAFSFKVASIDYSIGISTEIRLSIISIHKYVSYKNAFCSPHLLIWLDIECIQSIHFTEHAAPQ